jgi:uncharacterized protein DUF4124
MTPRLALAACVALVAASLGSRALADPPTIYKWIDENGVAHYTTDKSRIPSNIATRVERAPSVSAPAPTPTATTTHPDDELRDAVRVKPQSTVATPAPTPAPAPAATSTAAVPAPAAEPPPVSAPPPLASAPPETAHAPAPAAAPPKAAAPLATDKPAEPDPVSAPPPAPVAPLAPKQTAELAKIDGQIQSLEAEISTHEEKLAALISSTNDDQKPLVDDPQFREISQRLPKLQAELQSLREQRNKIQPPATP